MKKSRILLILLVLVGIFLLVYTPHYRYPFPRHVDEWHHITETIRLQEGGYPGKSIGLRVGFHVLLWPLSKIVNLVLVYRFLPAIWAVISALVLFYLVYKKTDRSFFTALLTMIFFASIKSNVNITGLWFFTPLTFSIPFIYLYMYFFTEGVQRENKKLILLSLLVMVILLPIHAISVLFALPFLLIYSLFNFKYIKKEWSFFSAFLMIPLAGMAFYKFIMRVPWLSLTKNLTKALQFKHGWGILEVNNSPLELYSIIGYILAAAGFLFIFANREALKKYLAYLLWPACLLISIVVYRASGTSYLVPYQRNLYYFALGLPLLSALGTEHLFKKIEKVSKEKADIFIVLIMLLTFWSYGRIPPQLDLYEAIDPSDYQALLFLSSCPRSVVMAPPGISEALYPVSRHWPVATYAFYGNRQDSERFFGTDDCRTKEEIVQKYRAGYVLSKSKIDCGWKLIYDNWDYIYEVAPGPKNNNKAS